VKSKGKMEARKMKRRREDMKIGQVPGFEEVVRKGGKDLGARRRVAELERRE
jgi:hypothetical protein